MTTAKPGTVKHVHELLEERIAYEDGVIADINERLGNVHRQSNGLVRIVQRKSRGITRANTGVAKLEREVQKLQRRVDEAVLALNSRDDARKGKALTDLTAQDKDVQDRYNELEGLIGIVGVSAAKAHKRLDDIEKSSLYGIDLEKTHVKIDSEVEVHTPWIEALIVGLAAAVVMALGLSWWTELSDEKIAGFAVIAFFVGFLFVSSLERFSVNLTGKLVWVRKKEEDTTAVLPTVIEDAPGETKEVDLKNTKQEVVA